MQQASRTVVTGEFSMTERAETGNNRVDPRRRVLLTGKLAYGDGFSLDCPIRDQSDTGARVVVGDQVLPKAVVLVSVTQGVAYEAEVIWRRGKEAGLRFTGSHPLKKARDETPSQIKLARHLWLESTAR